MDITDTQFNIYFSIKSFASMFPPFLFALIMNKVSLRIIITAVALIATIGQGFYAVGLQT